MFCPSCSTVVQPGQKFCTECGASLADITASMGVPHFEDDLLTPPAGVPLPPPTLMPPVATGAPGGSEFAATAALSVVEQTSPTGYAASPWEQTPGQLPAQGGDTGRVGVVQPFRITLLLVVSTLAAVFAVASVFVEAATYKVDGDFLAEQSFKLNDFASNLAVGAIIAAVVLIGGSLLGATGRRLGAGLAGGAGLALAGMFGWVIGQVIALFDAQEVQLLNSGGSFTLITTQEIGFWLMVVAAGLGVLAFLVSLTSAGNDGLPSLHPAIGALGALGTLAVVVGPLIPMNGAGLSDNFTNEFIPPASLYLRVAVLVLIGVGGLLGFLANRRWGIGMALGAICVGVWQWASALGEIGDLPVGIAGGNFVPDAANPFAPHIVTTIGVVVMLLAGLGGLLMAAQRRNAH